MKNPENILSIGSWYADIQLKGTSLSSIPENERTPELCFDALINNPSSPPDYFDFVESLSESKIESDGVFISVAKMTSESIADILNSSKLFIKSLNRLGMPDEYNKDALKYLEK